MKISQKLSISLFTATASLLSFSSGAFAGEGGAAGAAAFTITGTDVTGVAVAASVGKNDAGAAAFNTVDLNGTPLNTAFGLGSAGVINMGNIGANDGTQTMAGTADTALADAQGNSFTASGSINLGTESGQTIATTPGPAPAP